MNLSVDHNHKTGAVRGLLCNGCNMGLGRFEDNIEWLQNAIDYLIKTEATASGHDYAIYVKRKFVPVDIKSNTSSKLT